MFIETCDTLTRVIAQLTAAATRIARTSGARLIDMVAPPTCPVTGEAVAAAGALSAEAWRAIRFIDDPLCDACGVPFAVDYGDGALCPSCIATPLRVGRTRAALVYDDASRKLVSGFKHADRTENAAMFGAWMGRAGRALATPRSILVPVPLHRMRLLARRFNQSALLADAAAKKLGAQTSPELLIRTRRTPPQKSLSAAARSRNVAGAFSVPARQRHRVDGARIILVDDVLTTGATLSAAALALQRAGAAQVDALVLARVVKGDVGAV